MTRAFDDVRVVLVGFSGVAQAGVLAPVSTAAKTGPSEIPARQGTGQGEKEETDGEEESPETTHPSGH